jgi:hypothetical protein
VNAPTGGGGSEESDSGVSRRSRAISPYAVDTPSRSPVALNTRSWTPGTTLDTPALTPVVFRMLAMVAPALPMMIPASLVLTRARRTSWFSAGASWLGAVASWVFLGEMESARGE